MCVCILLLVIQHAKRMRRILLSSVVCLALPYFSTLPHKHCNFRGGGQKSLLNLKCILITLQLLSLTFLTLRRIQRGTVINTQGYS